MERRVPTLAEYESLLVDRSNWGRWGKDDQLGAINLITPAKRVVAASLVRTGRAVSLSRPFPKTPSAPSQPTAGLHYMMRWGDDVEGGCMDFLGIAYHGQLSTHVDALCHGWHRQGIWNGKTPAEVVSFDGCTWGAIEHWKEGLMTRGVFLDVPRFRKEPFVSVERPIHGWELEEIAKAQGVAIEPGDAIVVYGGREAWDRVNPRWGSDPKGRPGLHASCLEFIRQVDCSVIVWDMMDAQPSDYRLYPVHAALSAFGVALVDNALLEPLAAVCASEQTYDFMLSVIPLWVPGGTGSPVNPIAIF
jgi:kynurenine formamidase